MDSSTLQLHIDIAIMEAGIQKNCFIRNEFEPLHASENRSSPDLMATNTNTTNVAITTELIDFVSRRLNEI